MSRLARRQVLAGSALAGLLAALGRISPAFALTSEEELVEECRITVQSLLSDPDYKWLPDYIVKARGVIIFPSLIKGGFILGGEGGTGVLLGRLATSNLWSYPAFVYMGAASLGLQIGGQVSEVVLTIMNDDALDRLLRNNIKLGADASMAVGPIGTNAEAGTAGGFDNDIYTFGRAVGLFGGVSLEGAVIGEEQSRNQYYYGVKVSAADIIAKNEVSNVHADPLRNALPK